MRNKIISILLFLLFFILYSRFFIPSSVHASTTTLYFGPIEKTYDDSGRVVEEKVYYPAGSVTAVKTVNSEQETVNTNYLHSDHLGSTVLVTGENGDKKEENIYYPYGRQLTVNSEQSTDKLYTGQRLDSSSDLYFYNARYYNPTIGHFISADKAEGPNRYAYVGNNPVMRNDPSGRQGGIGDLFKNMVNQGMDMAKQKAQQELNWCLSNPEVCQQKYTNLYNQAKTLIPNDAKPISQANDVVLPKEVQHAGYLPIPLKGDGYAEDPFYVNKPCTKCHQIKSAGSKPDPYSNFAWSKSTSISMGGEDIQGYFLINNKRYEMLTGNDEAMKNSQEIPGTYFYPTQGGKAANFMWETLVLIWRGKEIPLNKALNDPEFSKFATSNGIDLNKILGNIDCALSGDMYRCAGTREITNNLNNQGIAGVRVRPTQQSQ